MSDDKQMDSIVRDAVLAIHKSHQDFVCVVCAEPILGFTDILSQREFWMSGLCQKCQDKVFRDEDADEETNIGTVLDIWTVEASDLDIDFLSREAFTSRGGGGAGPGARRP